MIDRLTKIQLGIFAVITAITLTVMAIFYLRLPATFGIGTYGVSADFVAGGGLYKNANVTYRGVAVGRVESVGLNPNGVTAEMRLNSGTPIPSNVTATVKSVSAVGEQYIDLVPPGNPASTKLHNGSRIERQNTRIGQDVADLLKRAEALVNSLGDTRLRELLHETFIAANGSGPELARLIESARLLVDEANANYPQVSELIDQAGPFLQAQIRAGADIKSLSDGLARFTSEVRQADPQLRSTLANAPGAIDEASTAFSGIRPSFPALAASLANLGRVGVIYHKSIEQLLVVLPALFAAITTAAGGAPQDEGAKLDFKLDLNDPPPCAVGFLPPPLMRTPADETLRELPRDMYCKVAQNDPSTVRGARNYPCQEFPGKRAPTIQLCRDPKGYVPVGRNPWRGPPVPYDTPVTNGLNVLPPNKFPYIPPGAEPDPGTPDRRAAPTRCGPRAGPAAEPPAGVRSAAAQRQRAAAGQPVVDAAGGPAGAAPAPVSEVAAAAATAGGDQSPPPGRVRRSRGGRRPARNRRPAVRPTPPMTNAPEPSWTRRAALVFSRPAPTAHPAPRIGWTSCLIQGLVMASSDRNDTTRSSARIARGGPGERRVERGRYRSGRRSGPSRSSLRNRVKALKPVKPPPRRQPNRVLVGWISFAAALLAIGALAGGLAFMLVQQRHAEAEQARDQRFVDTATQTVVNMFSYKQDNIDESVNRFYNGTSGPLRGMLGANNNIENLKGLFRSTNATSEAVINGAALEGIDAVTDNASVLVSVRVTVADIDGVNKPSMPYRLRVIVHEDEQGRMTGYDLKYPDGGN